MSKSVEAPDTPQLRFASARFGWLGRHGSLVFGTIGVLVLLAAWQICAVTGVVDVHISSDPSQVAREEITLFGNGTIWGPIGNTAAEVGWALAIIIVVGIPLGIILGRVTPLRQMTEPIVSILNSVPYALFLPLIIFWFGLGETARVLGWSGGNPAPDHQHHRRGPQHQRGLPASRPGVLGLQVAVLGFHLAARHDRRSS